MFHHVSPPLKDNVRLSRSQMQVGDLFLGSPRMQRLRVSFDTASGQAGPGQRGRQVSPEPIVINGVIVARNGPK